MANNKSKVITVRLKEKSFKVLQDYAAIRSLSVNSYLNSIIDSYAEFFIPLSSYQPVAIPKRLLATLFSLADKDKLNELAQGWAKEAKNATILLYGTEFNLESALDYTRKMAKYVLDCDARIMFSSDKDNKAITENNEMGVSMVIRHDLGENVSYYYGLRFRYFFESLKSTKVKLEHDDSTIYIKIQQKLL